MPSPPDKHSKIIQADTGDNDKLTPILRFPAFRSKKGWTETPVGQFLTESRTPGSGGDIAKKLTVKLWGRGVVAKADGVRGSENTQYYKRSAGQFIYSKLDFQNQAFGIIPPELDGYESTIDLPCFDVSESLNSKFLLEYVQRGSFYAKHGELADGNRKAKRIQTEDFLAFPIAVPEDFAEQQKIADCLTSLDEMIAAQGRKVEALKAHKKGLMQHLLPQEGQTLPRLRFPEFREAPEWEERPLISLAAYENGKAYEPDIVEGGRYVVVNSRFISTNGEARKYSNAEHLIADEADVLMVLSDLPNGRALAKCFYADKPGLYAVNQRVARLKPFDVHPRFLYYRLDRHSHLLAFDDGLGQTHLSKGDVCKCPLVVPTDHTEQQRIAACLSTLDARLAAEADRLDALKAHKKGLMQGLFPPPSKD